MAFISQGHGNSQGGIVIRGAFSLHTLFFTFYYYHHYHDIKQGQNVHLPQLFGMYNQLARLYIYIYITL